MRPLIALLAFGIIAVTAIPTKPNNAQQRIVGGSVTTIDRYPSMVSMLYSWDWMDWWQSCGGSIINSRHILTAAHCVARSVVGLWRARVGSTWADSGGMVHKLTAHIIHPEYNRFIVDNDIAIVRTASTIVFNVKVQAGWFAGAGYDVADGQPVWAAGWGLTTPYGQPSPLLRHVELFKINLNTCRNRYHGYRTVTDNMMCAGILDVGGRDTCGQDSGGPLIHRYYADNQQKAVIVGVTSWGIGCGDARFPGVYVRVQLYPDWIRSTSLYV